MNQEELKKAMAFATPDEKRRITVMLEELKRRQLRERAQNDFLAFVEYIWPDFISGRHHARMARLFESVAKGEKKRLAINLAPRHTKSEFASYLLPAWMLGKFPKKKIMQVSNTSELAEGFGRKVRNLVGSDVYREIFPEVELRQDSKAAGRWNTNHGGEYFATGVGGALAGRGSDLCIHKKTKVFSKLKGITEAENVVFGDCLLGSDGYGEVVNVIESTHEVTVVIDGIRFSEQHPIWTCNRGWVPAVKLTTLDLLQTVGIYDRLYALKPIRSVYETCNKTTKKFSKILFSCVQHMVWYAAKMFKPKCCELQQLRRSWSIGLRALEQVRQFYSRHGGTSITKTHLGQNRFKWELLSRKLQMVGHGDSVQQQEEQRCYNGIRGDKNFSAVGESHRPVEGYDKTSDIRDGSYTGGSFENETRKLGTKTSITIYITERICSSIRITRRYGEGYRVLQKENTQSTGRAFKIILRVLLGIRNPKSISVEHHSPEQFINFTVSGHNTFIADPYLTHNCIVDDPHTESEALAAQTNPAIYDKVYEWYTSGPRQRLQPGGAIILVMTRWHKRDLTGQIIKNSTKSEGMDQWDLVEFPAILPSGKPLWPEFWSIEELTAVKNEIPNSKWQAQYQQNPTSEEGAIVKREWWQTWEKDSPPSITYTLLSWDTAFEKHNRADYSALTVWGVFYRDDEDSGTPRPNIILLDAVKKRVEFPELKDWAYNAYKEWEPDTMIIEKRGSGASLIQELRRSGIPVQEFTPSKGNDKIARLNAVSDIFASGFVWAPETRWAEEVIDDVASFPAAEHDDLVDTVSQALLRFRQGGFVSTRYDQDDDEDFYQKKAAYY